MKLAAKAKFHFRSEPFVALVEDSTSSFRAPPAHRAWLRRESATSPPPDVRTVLSFFADETQENEVCLPPELNYLQPGDIIRLNPASSDVRVLYRRSSRHNVLFFTERCNSRCLMCSQPPRDIHDDYLVDNILQAIPWMAKETPELGITGGEPTLLNGKLIEVLEAVKRCLPTTSLHMLSNGRLFCYLRYAERIAAVKHPDFMIGVPVYSDIAALHDYVVQAKGAFDQTVLGLLNLGRVGLRIEIRMVIHRETYRRLPQFARFIARNFPFVDQVALMGLELMGYARSNLDALWIDPADYQAELEEAVDELRAAGLTVAIYNHQLCLLRSSLWPFARRSISDWKNIYVDECGPCRLRQSCCGFFASASLRRSGNVRPLGRFAEANFSRAKLM